MISNVILRARSYHIGEKAIVSPSQILWWIQEGRHRGFFSLADNNNAKGFDCLPLLQIGTLIVVRRQQYHVFVITRLTF